MARIASMHTHSTILWVLGGAQLQLPQVYCVRLILHSFRISGEGVETGWADLNGGALSTREMSAAFRQEVINDMVGSINHWKLISFSARILRPKTICQ